jgi:hypothetical protein
LVSKVKKLDFEVLVELLLAFEHLAQKVTDLRDVVKYLVGKLFTAHL